MPFIHDKHEVLGGEISVFKTKQSDVYQFRCWIPDEKKYVRQSLKTRDLETAKDRAKKRYFELMGNVQNGEKIFGITVDEIIVEYLKRREEDLLHGIVSKGRFTAITNYLKQFSNYVGGKTKLAEIGKKERHILEEYVQFLRNSGKFKTTTIIQCQQAVNMLIGFAYKLGKFHLPKLETQQIRIRGDERQDIRRKTFELKEYDSLVYILRSFSSKKHAPKDEIEKRLLFRDFVLIAANTCCRVGELWQLRWSDVLKYEEIKDGKNGAKTLVKIQIRAETSKVQKSRDIICRGGEYFQRIYSRSRFTEPDDLVFAFESADKILAKKEFYQMFSACMKTLEVDMKSRKISLYSLRHFGISCRLRAQVSVFDVAKFAGTSVSMIEKYYGVFDDEMSRNVSLREFKIEEDGITENIQ